MTRRRRVQPGAKDCFERALRIDEAAFGPEHPDVATDINNLGAVLFDQGDVPRALPYLERALAIREATLGPDHPDTQESRRNVEIARSSLDGGGG